MTTSKGKLSIFVLRELSALALLLSAAACRDLPKPEPFRPYEEHPIMPDENGYLSKESNSLRLQGNWFSYASLDSSITPAPLNPFSNDGRKLCARGVAAQVKDSDYDLYYGAAIGFDLCYADDDDAPPDFLYTLSECPWSPNIHRRLAGISFNIEAGDGSVEPGDTAPSETAGVPAEVRVVFREWNRDESAYVSVRRPGSYQVLFRDARVSYAADERPGTEPASVHSIHFQIPTVDTHPTPFDFCLSDLMALVDPRDPPPPPEVDTDSETGSDMTCQEAYPEDDAGDADAGPPDQGLEWVSISGGVFEMGSPDFEAEGPVREVEIETFEILKTEVTVEAYDRFSEETDEPCLVTGDWEICNIGLSPDEKRERKDHPANCVTWHQARAFCAWAGGRLPSEAEWEYAARSQGKETTYPWGDEPPTCELAVMDEDGVVGCGTAHTLPVCSRPDGNTDQGLCDMAGNVWEWVEDLYYKTYEGAPADGTARGKPDESGLRVKRGGGHAGGENALRATSRSVDDPSRPRDYGKIGFRCVR